jgi:hypothetical protein
MSLRFFFMLLFTPIACAIAVRRPFHGLLALVAMYYFRPEIWDAPTWFRPQLLLTVAVGVGWIVNMKEFRWDSLATLAAMTVVGFFATSFFATDDPGVAYDGAVVLAKLVVVMIFTLNLVDTPQKMRSFLWANVLGFVYNLKSVYVTGLTGNEIQTRVDVGVGQGGGANYIAMICAIAFAICYVRFEEGARRERWLAAFMVGAYLLALVLTGSRAGILAVGVVGGYFLLRSILQGSKRAVGGAVTLGVLALIFFAIIPQEHLARFQGITRSQDSGSKFDLGGGAPVRDNSAQSRLDLWTRGAIPMFLQRPGIGVGMDNFQLASPRFVGFYASKNYAPYIPGVKGRGFVAHSTWFQTLAEGGLMMSAPFFAMFVVAFAKLGRVRRLRGADPRLAELRSQAVQLTGALLAFCTTSTFGSHIKIDFYWWYMGAIGAIALMARRILAADEARRRDAVRGATLAAREARLARERREADATRPLRDANPTGAL